MNDLTDAEITRYIESTKRMDIAMLQEWNSAYWLAVREKRRAGATVEEAHTAVIRALNGQ